MTEDTIRLIFTPLLRMITKIEKKNCFLQLKKKEQNFTLKNNKFNN